MIETATLIPDTRAKTPPRERRIGHVGQAYLDAQDAKRQRAAVKAKTAIAAMAKAAERRVA